MKKILSLVVMFAAVAMVGCCGNCCKKAAAEKEACACEKCEKCEKCEECDKCADCDKCAEGCTCEKCAEAPAETPAE